MHRGEANGQYPLKDSQGETYYQETREGRRDQAAGDWASVNRNGKPHEIDSNSVEQRRPTSTTTDTAGARRTSAQHSREDDAASVPASPSSVTAALKSLKKKPSMLLSFLKRRPSPAATSSVPVPAHYLSLPIGGTITLSPSMPTTPNGGVYSLCSEDLSSSEFAKLAGITILPDIDDEMEDYNYEDSMQGPGGSSSSTGTGHRGVSGLGLGAAGSASASIHRTLLSNASTTGGVSSSGLSSTTATGGILDRERNATNYSLASDSSRRKVNIWDPLFWTTPNKDSPVMVTTTAAESSNDAQVEGAGDNSQQRQQRTSNNSSSTNTVESPSVSATSYFPAMPGTTTAVTPLPMRIVTRERSATMIQLSGSAPMSRPLQPSGHFSRVHASSPSPPLPSPLGAKQHQLHSQHGMPVSSSASSRRHSSAVSPMSGSMSPSSPPTPTIIHRQMAYASSGANQLSPTASAPPSPTSAMPLSPFAMAPAVAEELQQVRRRPSSLRLQGIANGGGGSGKDSPAVPTTAATSAVLLPHHVPGRRKSFSSLTALAIELDHETTEDQSAAVATAVTEFSAPANGTSSDGDAAAAVRIKVVNPTPPAMSDAYFERRVHPLSPLTAVFPNGGDEMHGEHGSGSSDSGGSGMVRQQSSHGRLEGVRGSRFQPVYSSSSSSSASTRSSSRSRSRSRSRSPTPSANMTGKRLSPLSKEYDPNGSGGSSSNGGHLHHHQHGHHSHHHHHHHHHHHPLRPSNSRSHNGHSRFELCTADGTSLTDLKAAGRGGDRLSPLSATSDNRAIAVNNPHQHHHHHHHRSSLQHANSASGVSGVRRFSHQNHLSPVSAYNSSTGGSISSSTSSSSNSSSSSGGSSGGDTLSPTATTKSTTKGPTARFPSSHQRTLSLPSSPLPPIPVPISYASSSSSSAMAPSGYHRGSEMLSSSYQERSILSSCASSRHLHPFDQPLPSPGPLQSPSTPTARAPLPPPFAPSSAPSSSSSSSTKSSLEPRHFTPGTKVGRFTLVEDKGTTGVDVMEASRLRRGSQLSTLSQYSSTGTAAATATMDVGLGVASSSPPSSNSGGDHLHHHELLIMRAGIDHQHHPMRRPSSSLSNASSTYNMDGSIASDHQHHQHFGRTKTTLDSSDDHQQGEGGGGGEGGLLDDDENEERGGRVVVDTEENCLVFQRKKKRGHPKRRVPATCSFTATAAATSAESPFSLQAQMQQQQQQSPPLLSPPHSHPQLHHRRPMDQMSSSLPTSFLLPSGDMMANGGHGGGGGGLVGSSSDEFAPSSHP
ncbi:hypothetical protein DFQ27_007560 [Actinomortierella ambigua]|uniref:Uncharacterized protein n=1 Tax=Actinomortierella ambigua TaxID=1343610 RepID=A0A9P6QLK7_9FUNG|nr:hypothetical protein DFQ27_007560 [Actinomortierella ambigua]